ncbi:MITOCHONDRIAL GROUP I INTRON SPLICING FACTOR CCM1 [Salix koriyanagi]|uniref:MITOCHONDRIAL GROUP I INTRON SPLICING FACTOR CCM1 n=1 Tax=Salix koriyanagi TaxID=2511006 RepID=A0A9Q0ZC38_9ROSI|nr:MITOCHONDRIAL GROUP I INTRON SPLICING FACTOR CCM1 [Salix koriyanagi]
MALFARLRLQFTHLRHHINFSTSPLSSKSKTRATLSLLKSETNPEKILEICRSASLTPYAHIDRITLSVAIDKLAKSNNFSYIDDLLTDLRTSRPDLRTVRFAAHSIILYGQAGMLDHAIRLFKEYHEKNQNDAVLTSGSVKLLNALLFSCILAKKHDEVKRVFVDFSQRYKIEPNLETFNTVIQSFCESGSSSSCYSVLNEMDTKGVKPNETTFGHLFAGFYSEEKYEDVGTVSKMIEEDYGINAGIGVYNIRIHSLCKLKRAKEAKVLLEGCLSKGIEPNGVTYSHLILGFCMEGDMEEAKRLFMSMENRGCQPAYSCYATLVYFLGKVGDFESAYWVCKESMGKKMVPNISTMKILVQGLASSGELDKAKELIGEVKGRFSKNIELWNEVEAGLPQ